ncbi:MAG: glucoamylase family protein, partial [Steroidobacteraceae bacterium]
VDAFRAANKWYAATHLAIDQGPIIIMIERYRTGPLWKLLVSCAEIREGLRRGLSMIP